MNSNQAGINANRRHEDPVFREWAENNFLAQCRWRVPFSRHENRTSHGRHRLAELMLNKCRCLVLR
jgi:hypothetical protein